MTLHEMDLYDDFKKRGYKVFGTGKLKTRGRSWKVPTTQIYT